MPLVNMKKMLIDAVDNNYAVGAFNILDYNSMRAVIDCANELSAPVIVQTSVKTVKLWGQKTVGFWARELCETCTVPVALHLDHCTDVDYVAQCIDHGWSSVMIDASAQSFETNLEWTTRVVGMAKPHNISVEAELGAIVGVEDDIFVQERDAHLADPDLSEQFCQAVDIDCFAPAIGTAHGIYTGEPVIAYDLIESITKRTRIPLALHGGTGLSDEVFKKCIALGCAKINISTQLKYVFIDSFVRYVRDHSTEYNPLKPLAAQYDALKQNIAEKIILFGSAGKAGQEKM
jgi:ketose-bisphosphate aldolase